MNESSSIIIKGGKPLSGTISIESNKNAVLPVLCATMLTSEGCVLNNTPMSPDVLKILQAIDELGGTHSWNGSTLSVNCKNINNQPISDCVKNIQSGILFVGPLLARFGTVNIPVSIGCKLGYRGPEDHIDFLSRLGVTCEPDVEANRITFTIDKKSIERDHINQDSNETITRNLVFSESSVTPTENLLMLLSAVTKYDVHLEGIAQEPHVKFLTQVLKKMGMIIDGEGIITCKGSHETMKGFEVDFAQEPDFVDFYGMAITVAMTKGNVLLECAVTPAISHMIEFLRKTGIACEVIDSGVMVKGSESTYHPAPGFSKADETHWKLNPRPWPGFPVDCLPSFIAWACMNTDPVIGTTVNNWMYEGGLDYAEQLADLGAEIIFYRTPLGMQKIVIKGISDTKIDEVVVPGVAVIEGTRALISYALSQDITVTIQNIEPMRRRSPKIVETFNNAGADIKML